MASDGDWLAVGVEAAGACMGERAWLEGGDVGECQADTRSAGAAPLRPPLLGRPS